MRMLKEKWKFEGEKNMNFNFSKYKINKYETRAWKMIAPNDIMKYAFCNPIGFHVSRTIYYYNNII